MLLPSPGFCPISIRPDAHLAELPDCPHPQIPERKEVLRIHAAEGSRSGGAFWAEMLAPRGEDLVHKSLRSERQAIGKVAHPAGFS